MTAIKYAFLGLMALLAFGLAACGGDEGGDAERITLARGFAVQGGLLDVALARGYFEDAGLDISFQVHTTGRDALNSVLEGQADVASAADTPIVHSAMRGERTFTIATIGTTAEGAVIIARRDRGISEPTDLTGKQIGATVGTSSEFFLDAFLALQAIPKHEVKVVDVRPGDMVETLMSGEVDAVSAWQPYVLQLQEEFGDDGVRFDSKGIYKSTWNLTSTPEFVQNHPGALEKLIFALVRAENYVEEAPMESRKLISDASGIGEATLDALWTTYAFEVTLDQALLITMEDQARWAMDSGLTNATSVPNFLDYLYFDALQQVKPEAITVIR